MTAFVVLLRAVNVGGTGKLPMAELRAIAAECGFTDARTHIASGNLIFTSDKGESAVKAALEAKLTAHLGKPVGVAVRTAAEMAGVRDGNPFDGEPPNRTVAIFLDAKPPSDALDHVAGGKDERLALGTREIYVHYPSGQADTKLRIPAAKEGTGRNMNTVAKLADMAAEI